MTVPQITTTMTVPDYNLGRAAFVAASNQFGYNMTPYATQANAVATFVNDRAVAADTAANDAADNASAAATSALNAQTAATATAATWVSGAAYALNDRVWSSATSGQLYRCISAHSGISTPPANDAARWALVLVDPARVAAVEAAINGLLDVPIKVKGAAHTLDLTDRGCCISTTANVTIPANASVAFPVGSTIVIRNRGGTAINVSITTDTLRLAGTTKTGVRTIGAYGEMVIHKDAATTWFSSGAGLT